MLTADRDVVGIDIGERRAVPRDAEQAADNGAAAGDLYRAVDQPEILDRARKADHADYFDGDKDAEQG